MIRKPCFSRFSLHKFVHLKFFWTQFKNVHLQGPCSLGPCISRPYCIYQASGALGETSDESDFSLLAWDSFSQEIRDLFTVVRSITYILLSKLFEFTWNAVIFFLKKKNCVIFIEKREKQNKIRKNKLNFKKRPKKNLTIYRKEKNWVWHYCKNIAVTSQNNL